MVIFCYNTQAMRPNMRSFLHTVQKNQMLMMTPNTLGRTAVIKSFIKHNTPLKVDPKVSFTPNSIQSNTSRIFPLNRASRGPQHLISFVLVNFYSPINGGDVFILLKKNTKIRSQVTL